MRTKLNVKVITNKNDFYSMKNQWGELLGQSQANKLFLSWQWQYSWWQSWGDELGLDLLILQAFKGAELVGLAPLYLDHIKVKGIFPSKRIQFIGNAWNRVATVRTEYLEFIAAENMEEAVCDSFLHYISEFDDWDEFVLCDVPKYSTTYKSIQRLKKKRLWHFPQLETDYGVKIRSHGSFKEYLSSIGSNTRLKLYNRRKYLQSLKDVEIKVASQHEVDYYFSLLNGFHHERWGKPCFREAALKFHKILIGHLDECQGYELCCIFIDSKPISLLYNLTAGDVSYNIQAGYVENYDKKLSLGTMHLGYAIEQAFEDKAINAFDLLIGSGKNEFYKNKYKGDVLEFETIHIVHSKVLILFYYFLTIIPEPVRKYLSGFKQKYFE